MAVDTKRKEFADMRGKWERCRDVIAGEDAVKAKGPTYLPMLGGQNVGEYDAYKLRATFYEGVKLTRDALVGLVMKKPPDVDSLPTPAEALVKDITLDDTPLAAFAQAQLEEVLGVGRYGIFIDMPRGGWSSSGEAPAPVPAPDSGEPVNRPPRPYLVPYRTEQIINWRKSIVNGDSVLSLVVLQEEVEVDKGDFDYECVTQWRVLQLQGGVYTVTVFRRKDNKSTGEFVVHEPPVAPLRRGKTLDFIPFIPVRATGLQPEPVEPPLLGMVDVSLSLYRTDADLEHGCHWTALPTPVLSGVNSADPIRIGSGTAITLPVGGEAKMLEFSGSGLAALEARSDKKIDRMATLGARILETDESSAGKETATGVKARQGSSQARLKTVAITSSQALTKAMRIMCWWAGFTNDVNDEKIVVTLNANFAETNLTPEEVKTRLLAVQAGQMSPETFYDALAKGGWARPGITYEQERADIEAAIPEEDPLEDDELDDETGAPKKVPPKTPPGRTPPATPPRNGGRA